MITGIGRSENLVFSSIPYLLSSAVMNTLSLGILSQLTSHESTYRELFNSNHCSMSIMISFSFFLSLFANETITDITDPILDPLSESIFLSLLRYSDIVPNAANIFPAHQEIDTDFASCN